MTLNRSLRCSSIACARDFQISQLEVGRLLDQELVHLKMQELEKYLNQLKKYRGITAEELTNNLEKRWTVQHGLQLCIQVVLDTGNHILAEAGVPVKEYADIFPELARLDVVPADFAENVKGMAGLRNLLVHEYSELDLQKIAEVINTSLDDFSFFGSYILAYLKQEEDK